MLASLVLAAATAATSAPPPTLRIDWQHGGDATTEHQPFVPASGLERRRRRGFGDVP